MPVELAYVIFVTFSALGTLQLVAARYGLQGLFFFPARPRASSLAGLLTISVSYYWFFSSADRNVPGLEGAQLTFFFSLSCLLAISITLTIGSLVSRQPRSLRPPAQANPPGPSSAGLDALKRAGYFQLLRAPLRLPAARARRLFVYGWWNSLLGQGGPLPGAKEGKGKGR
ncbi:MAG: hypothetical protein HY783_08750 [Chloroflexi bacterium]|nr:hypothetical protein [Chloroflexota bacterium]